MSKAVQPQGGDLWDIELPAGGSPPAGGPWPHLDLDEAGPGTKQAPVWAPLGEPLPEPAPPQPNKLPARGARSAHLRLKADRQPKGPTTRRYLKVGAWATAMVLIASIAYALVDNRPSGEIERKSASPAAPKDAAAPGPAPIAPGALELAPAATAGPALTAADVAVAEGSAGESAALFQVTLAAAAGQKAQVDFSTANDTAIAEADYRPAKGTLVFEPGETAKTIKVELMPDTQAEPDETFFLNFTNPSGVSLPDPQAAAKITNDDAGIPGIPSVSIADVRVKEGDRAVFVITISTPSPQPVSINYATANGSATAPSDYGNGSGVINFKPRETKAELSVVTVADASPEPDESFVVNLSNPVNMTLGDAQGQATITEGPVAPPPAAAPPPPPPPGPGIRIDDLIVAEGVEIRTVSVTVSLSSPAAGEVSVEYSTRPDTAESPGDYVDASATLVFKPGETTKSIPIQIIGDSRKEPEEAFFVNLSGAKGSPLADNQAKVTIQDDD